jgi:Tol biopolymer transport system component
MKANGTEASMLTDGDAPSWSPDGKRIALSTAKGQNQLIQVIRADGSSLTTLTDGGVLPQIWQGGGGDIAPAWSHDGTRIAFIRLHFPGLMTDGVFVMNADGSGISQVSDDEASHLAWLANDQGIAFDAPDLSVGPGAIHRFIVGMNLDGSNRRLLFSVPDYNAGGLAVAPDGVHFAFDITRCAAGIQGCLLECQVMVAGSDLQPVQVTHDGQCNHNPSWSPDGSKLVIDNTYQISVINPDGSNRQPITTISDHLDTQAVWTAA